MLCLANVSVAANQSVLHLYRQMISLARLLPQPKRDTTLQRIREGFKQNRSVSERVRVCPL